MKVKFDNAGVAQMQASVLSLPLALRQVETQEIRLDFTGWMLKKFTLTPQQLEQLKVIQAKIGQNLAEAIATSYEQGKPVVFTKDTKDDDDDPDIKDIIIDGLEDLLNRKGVAKNLMINIRYRYIP